MTMMSEEERKTISVLERLSRKLSTRKLLDLYSLSGPFNEFDGKFYFTCSIVIIFNFAEFSWLL